jgi:2-amino-4-hydroxy-6-hydroxymethyldihydropteridine diphosphokinase
MLNAPVFLLLGTNLGNRAKNLRFAIQRLEDSIGKIVRLSSVYETAAWGKSDQPEFYNQVIQMECDLNPFQLMESLINIEKEMGRVRLVKWGPRVIDLDILFYGNMVMSTSDLTLPHPGIPDRLFTLIPLNELAPDLVHPVLNKTISDLLAACPDKLVVTPVKTH